MFVDSYFILILSRGVENCTCLYRYDMVLIAWTERFLKSSCWTDQITWIISTFTVYDGIACLRLYQSMWCSTSAPYWFIKGLVCTSCFSEAAHNIPRCLSKKAVAVAVWRRVYVDSMNASEDWLFVCYYGIFMIVDLLADETLFLWNIMPNRIFFDISARWSVFFFTPRTVDSFPAGIKWFNVQHICISILSVCSRVRISHA